MPGSGRKGKSKQKSSKSNPSIEPLSSKPGHTADAEDFYLSQIDDVEEWKTLIDTLCEFPSLPDLNSRSGLKKIYADFNAIYARMDSLFQKSQDHIRVRGAIVGIFAKMSIISLLRNKLFEKDILDNVIPLLQEDETQHLALRVLSTVTHHGGAQARMEVAKHSNSIAKLISDLPDDEVVAELSIAILAQVFAPYRARNTSLRGVKSSRKQGFQDLSFCPRLVMCRPGLGLKTPARAQLRTAVKSGQAKSPDRSPAESERHVWGLVQPNVHTPHVGLSSSTTLLSKLWEGSEQ